MPYKFLSIIHELLTSYQRLQWPKEPDEGVARVVLAVEMELQEPNFFYDECTSKPPLTNTNKENHHEENHCSDYFFSFTD